MAQPGWRGLAGLLWRWIHPSEIPTVENVAAVGAVSLVTTATGTGVQVTSAAGILSSVTTAVGSVAE